MSENQNTEQKSSQIEWKELDEAIRKMVVMSNFEKDLENYKKLSELYQIYESPNDYI